MPVQWAINAAAMGDVCGCDGGRLRVCRETNAGAFFRSRSVGVGEVIGVFFGGGVWGRTARVKNKPLHVKK